MGKKSAAKGNQPPPASPASAGRRLPLKAIAGLLILGVAVAGIAYWRNSASDADQQAAAAAAPVPVPVGLKPHKQDHYPPLEFPTYAMPRSPEEVTAAYHFAAEHPEVLSYIPCFCGCERSGHRGNEDCFVQARDVNGDVIQWTDHGMECAVCLDVATRARKMHEAGASVAEIRAAIDKDWSPRAQTHTPTPEPPRN